jgi:hypothetical protein
VTTGWTPDRKSDIPRTADLLTDRDCQELKELASRQRCVGFDRCPTCGSWPDSFERVKAQAEALKRKKQEAQ